MGAPIQSRRIDAVAFIGTANSAKGMLKGATNPRRLRVMYEGEAKNVAILLPDADLEIAIESCASGMSSFNGQRCTATKMIWVHSPQAEEFLKGLAKKIDSLKLGMPWDDTVKITPLCKDSKATYIKELVEGALSHGAHIVNDGGKCFKTLCTLSILASATKRVGVWHEEQFGPLHPSPSTTTSKNQSITSR
jgi:glyceraldehyde-3-phosphate dehydrogenase (NADP+)